MSTASNRYVWYVILLLSVVNVFSYMDRMALAVLLPYLKADFELTDGQLGLLIGFAFSLFYAICGIPIARLGDRSNRKNIIAVALAVWSLMTAMSGAAQNFWHLFAARVGIGAGEAGCVPPAQSIICDYVPLHRRAGVFAVHNFGSIGGLMLGMTIAGWLGEIIGWRGAFVVLGLPGLALALIVWFTLREPLRGAFDRLSTGVVPMPLPLRETLFALWRIRTYRYLTLLYALNGFIQYGFHQWWPSFYVRTFDLSPASLGLQLGMAFGLGAGIGLLGGGWLANKLVLRDVRLPLMIGVVATLLSIPSVLGTLFAPTASESIMFVALTAMLWHVAAGAVVANVTSVVRPEMRATAGAINILFSAVLGFGLGPTAVGVLSDLLKPALGVEALRYAMLLPVCVLPMMALMYFAAARVLSGDLRVAEHSSPGRVEECRA